MSQLIVYFVKRKRSCSLIFEIDASKVKLFPSYAKAWEKLRYLANYHGTDLHAYLLLCIRTFRSWSSIDWKTVCFVSRLLLFFLLLFLTRISSLRGSREKEESEKLLKEENQGSLHKIEANQTFVKETWYWDFNHKEV